MLNNIYKGKTVLITGASGLIGSNLVARLLQFDGIRVIALGRNVGKLKHVFKDFAGNPALALFEHDISSPIPISIGAIDYVYHAAGPISGQAIRNEPFSVVSANLKGLLNCFDYLGEQKAKIGLVGTVVVFSSATVYGNAYANNIALKECETTRAEMLDSPTAPYSESKRMAEVMARAYAGQHGLHVKIARFSYVYGHCKLPPDTAFYEFISKAVRGEDLAFKQSGFARRDNIYVEDAVSGVLHVCEFGNDGEPYNVSSCGRGGNFAAIDEIANEISIAANSDGQRRVRVVVQGENARGAGFMLDNSKLIRLGWEPAVSLADGVRQVFCVYASANNFPCKSSTTKGQK